MSGAKTIYVKCFYCGAREILFIYGFLISARTLRDLRFGSSTKRTMLQKKVI